MSLLRWALTPRLHLFDCIALSVIVSLIATGALSFLEGCLVTIVVATLSGVAEALCREHVA